MHRTGLGAPKAPATSQRWFCPPSTLARLSGLEPLNADHEANNCHVADFQCKEIHTKLAFTPPLRSWRPSLKWTTYLNFANMYRSKFCTANLQVGRRKCRISVTKAALAASKCALPLPLPSITATLESVWQQNLPPQSPAGADPAGVTLKHRTVCAASRGVRYSELKPRRI